MSQWRLSRESADAFEEFQAFHAGLMELRRRAERGHLLADGESSVRAMSPRDIFIEIHGHLTDLGYGRRAQGTGDRLDEVDRGYVLASFADEMFLHMAEWEGRGAWSGMLVENALYGSQVAGERVFEAADRLLARQDASRRDLAMTILIALSLGFRGRYRGAAKDKHVARYREELFELIHQRPAPPRIQWDTYLGQAYDHTLATGSRSKLPSARPWMAAIAAVIILYLAASHLQWMNAASSIDALADEIITFDADGG